MGIFVVFQVAFAGIKKILHWRKIRFDEYTLRSLLGIIYILAVLFSLQISIPHGGNSWVFVNFQLVSIIFYTVILSVPHKYHLFTPIIIAFMIFNSALTSWQSWCMTIALIGFYDTLNYIKDHTKEKFPLLKYLITSIFFGAVYWFFVKLKFSISYTVFFNEILDLAILEVFTFGYIAMLFTDVESRMALFREATHDKLTSAFNYDAFDTDFRFLFTRFKNTDENFSMMMFDVDHFKEINDTYGHLAGDKVLQNVVQVVQEVIDNNNPRIKLYRTGGEEFNVLLPDYDVDATEEVVKKIFSAINHSQTIVAHNTVKLTVSMGVSEVNVEDVSINDFYSRVDNALYHSKRNGRKEITFDRCANQ